MGMNILEQILAVAQDVQQVATTVDTVRVKPCEIHS